MWGIFLSCVTYNEMLFHMVELENLCHIPHTSTWENITVVRFLYNHPVLLHSLRMFVLSLFICTAFLFYFLEDATYVLQGMICKRVKTVFLPTIKPFVSIKNWENLVDVYM